MPPNQTLTPIKSLNEELVNLEKKVKTDVIKTILAMREDSKCLQEWMKEIKCEEREDTSIKIQPVTATNNLFDAVHSKV